MQPTTTAEYTKALAQQRRDDKYASTKEKRTLQAVQKMSSLGKDVTLLSKSRAGNVKLMQPTSLMEQIRDCAPADQAYINASLKGAGKSLSHWANIGPKGHIGRPAPSQVFAAASGPHGDATQSNPPQQSEEAPQLHDDAPQAADAQARHSAQPRLPSQLPAVRPPNMDSQTAGTADGRTHPPITAEARQAAVRRYQPPPLPTPEVADMQRELAKPTGCYKCRQLRAYLRERLGYQGRSVTTLPSHTSLH